MKGPVRNGLPLPNSADIVAETGGDSMVDLPRRAYYHHARAEVLELVPPSAHRVLDVGCGEGTLGASIRARQPAEVHGVELVQNAAARARHRLDRVWNSSVEQALPTLPDGYYDCIVAADVLEHLIDPWAVLTALKSKLAPGGTIVSSIPNIQNWAVLADLVRGKWEYEDEGTLDRTHLRFFTRRSVEELFWTAGLSISSLTTTVRGAAVPQSVLKALARSGLATRELEQDSQTFQFLVVAQRPHVVTTPRVAVVILNWNGKDDTLACLQSVNKSDYSNYRVVVVDNGSTDSSVVAIKRRFPDVVVLETGRNLGFAGGNNVGIRYASDTAADYVFLLNNDTVIASDLIDALVNASISLPERSILGPKIYFHSDPHSLWFAGGRWLPAKLRFSHVAYRKPDSRSNSQLSETDYVTGCALFARTSAFDAVGLLDERFFLTYEETDWCYRAKDLGYRCFVVPAARVWHKVSVSFGGAQSPMVAYFMTRNRLLWGRKHLSRRDRLSLYLQSWRTLRRILAPPFVIRRESKFTLKLYVWAIGSWYRNVLRNFGHPGNMAILFGIRDYALRRFGDCPARIRRINDKWRNASPAERAAGPVL